MGSTSGSSALTGDCTAIQQRDLPVAPDAGPLAADDELARLAGLLVHRVGDDRGHHRAHEPHAHDHDDFLALVAGRADELLQARHLGELIVALAGNGELLSRRTDRVLLLCHVRSPVDCSEDALRWSGGRRVAQRNEPARPTARCEVGTRHRAVADAAARRRGASELTDRWGIPGAYAKGSAEREPSRGSDPPRRRPIPRWQAFPCAFDSVGPWSTAPCGSWVAGTWSASSPYPRTSQLTYVADVTVVLR